MRFDHTALDRNGVESLVVYLPPVAYAINSGLHRGEVVIKIEASFIWRVERKDKLYVTIFKDWLWVLHCQMIAIQTVFFLYLGFFVEMDIASIGI